MKYEIVFEENPWHRYWKVYEDGRREQVPSVTKINGVEDKSNRLIPWAARVTAEYIIKLIPDIKSGDLILTPDDVKDLFKKAKAEAARQRDEAAVIGTKTHKAIEDYLKTGKKPKGLAPEVQKPFNGFLTFAKEMKLGKVIETEKILYSEYGYAGRMDILAYLGSKKFLIDVKTSANFYSDMPRQLAAYANAYEEKTGETIEGVGIIRLDKESGLPYWKDYSEEREISFQMFLSLLDFVKLRDGKKK